VTHPISWNSRKGHDAKRKPIVSEHWNKWKHSGKIIDQCSQGVSVCHIGLEKVEVVERSSSSTNPLNKKLLLFFNMIQTTRTMIYILPLTKERKFHNFEYFTIFFVSGKNTRFLHLQLHFNMIQWVLQRPWNAISGFPNNSQWNRTHRSETYKKHIDHHQVQTGSIVYAVHAFAMRFWLLVWFEWRLAF